MTDQNPAVQEYVRSRRRNVLVYMTSVAMVSILLFLYIWQYVKIVEVEKIVLEVRRENAKLKEEIDVLLAEKAQFEQLERVEAIAGGRLGMGHPKPEQIWFIPVERRDDDEE